MCTCVCVCVIKCNLIIAYCCIRYDKIHGVFNSFEKYFVFHFFFFTLKMSGILLMGKPAYKERCKHIEVEKRFSRGNGGDFNIEMANELISISDLQILI